jgi:hypothetical protein
MYSIRLGPLQVGLSASKRTLAPYAESWYPRIRNTGEEGVSSYEAAETEPLFQPAKSPLSYAAFEAAETVDQMLGDWRSATDPIGTLENNPTENLGDGSIAVNSENTYACAVHCVFTTTRGQKETLHGITRTSHSSEVYDIPGLQMGTASILLVMECVFRPPVTRSRDIWYRDAQNSIS